MTTTKNRLIIALLAISIFSTFALAQETAEAPLFVSLNEEKVHPGLMADYLEGTKLWIAEIEKAEIPLNFFAFRDGENGFHYGVTLKSLGEMDGLSLHWKKAVKILRSTDWGRKRQAAIASSRYTIWMSGPELSYTPENPDITDSEMQYMESIDIKVSHANEYAFYVAMIKLKALHKAKGIQRGYDVYRNIIGEEGPLYTVVVGGKDPAEYFQNEMKIYKLLGEEGMEFYSNLMKLVDSYTHDSAWMQSELSYFSK
jgi:hypothetical protein